MYALQIEYGNGYRCSCCRKTRESIYEYETFEDAMKAIARIEHIHEHYSKMRELGLCNEDDDDVCILDFFETKRPERDEAMIARFMAEHVAEITKAEEAAAAKAKADEEEKARQDEINKRAQYEKLKAEFEGQEVKHE